MNWGHEQKLVRQTPRHVTLGSGVLRSVVRRNITRGRAPTLLFLIHVLVSAFLHLSLIV